MRQKREWPLSFFISAGFGIVSLGLAILIRTGCINQDPFGYILIGLWALVPPVWFLLEYEYKFPEGHEKPAEDLSRLKHLH